MDKVPDHLKRCQTRAGREALAVRLGLSIDSHSQDWEWEIADPEHFADWLAAYKDMALSEDERFSLMEMLIQCVEEMASRDGPPGMVEELPAWQEVATLLRANPRLHASTIAYWCLFGHNASEEQFRVSVPMRRVWAEVQPSLSEPNAAADRPRE